MLLIEKAIKVKKICKSRIKCEGCIYLENCKNSYTFFNSPDNESIEELAKAIKEEKWEVK